MQIETTIEEAELSLAAPAETYGPSTGWIRSGWILGQLVLTGLLLTYLVAWVHDFQRIRQLVAEPTPPSKVITKNEAWQRIYSHAARKVWQASAAQVPQTGPAWGGRFSSGTPILHSPSRQPS